MKIKRQIILLLLIIPFGMMVSIGFAHVQKMQQAETRDSDSLNIDRQASLDAYYLEDEDAKEASESQESHLLLLGQGLSIMPVVLLKGMY